MTIRTYEVQITGATPLLLHHDDIDWADAMDAWKNDPANRGKSKAGDDRTPAYRWIGCLYHDGEHVAIPSANMQRSLMAGGAMVPTGKGKQTFKSQTMSGMSFQEGFLEFRCNGRQITYNEIRELIEVDSFAAHVDAAQSKGFELFKKRARVGTSKHIRVRPKFDVWSITGLIDVWDDQITDRVLYDFFAYAGNYKGLGDWRPSSPTPGPYGRFTAEVKRVN